MIWSRNRQLAFELNRNVETAEARTTIGIMRPVLRNGTHTTESAGAILRKKYGHPGPTTPTRGACIFRYNRSESESPAAYGNPDPAQTSFTIR